MLMTLRFNGAPQQQQQQQQQQTKSTPSDDSASKRGDTTKAAYPEPRNRQKRWTSKSKTGCFTCRARRIKCDETRPACLRCTKYGRSCAGYPPLPDSDAKTEEQLSSRPGHITAKTKAFRKLAVRGALALSQPVLSVCPLQVRPSRTERMLFDYFCTEVAPTLMGDFDKDIWTVHTLQIIQNQPYVWHACNAVAAIHQENRLGGRRRITGNSNSISRRSSSSELVSAIQTSTPAPEANDLHIHALQQYSASLKYIMDMISQNKLSIQDKENIVLVNTLFMVLCFLRGDVAEAYVHLYNGSTLISQWHLWDWTRHCRDRDKSSIRPVDSIFSLYQRADSVFMHLRPALQKRPDFSGADLELLDMEFDSFKVAYMQLELIWNVVMEMALDAGREMDVTRGRHKYIRRIFTKQLEGWRTHFRRFQHSQQIQTRHFHAESILELHYMVLKTVLSNEDQHCETSWDLYEADFISVLRFAQMLCSNQLEHSTPTQSGRATPPVAEAAVSASSPMSAASIKSTQLSPASSSSGSRSAKRHVPRTFGLAPSLTGPLYFVARRCRNPSIRRQAVAALESEMGVVGAMDAALLARMARVIIDVEEKAWNPRVATALGPDMSDCICKPKDYVCLSHRVTVALMSYPAESSAEIWLSTVYDVNHQRPRQKVSLGSRAVDVYPAEYDS